MVGIGKGMPEEHRFLCLLAPTILLLLYPGSARAQHDAVAQLHRLGKALPDEYIVLRDDILAGSNGPMDVEEAARLSWQAGLAGYIVNERLADPEAFAHFESLRPAMAIRGNIHCFGGIEVSDVVGACLVECMWKETKRSECTEEAHILLISRWKVPYRLEGPLLLWQRIYDEAEDLALRQVAVGVIAGIDSREARVAVERIVLDKKVEESLRILTIQALDRHTPRYAGDVLLRFFDEPQSDKVAATAAWVLAKREGVAERERAREILADDSWGDKVRLSILNQFAARRQPNDVPVLLSLLEPENPIEFRFEVAPLCAKYEDPRLRQAVLRMIQSADNWERIAKVAHSYASYASERELDELLALADNDGKSTQMREGLVRCVQGERELRERLDSLDRFRQSR